ncbi:MAG TPA: CHAT domain-containing tetratricopeptide repeat protein [Thermoanaerobaculia bacterium]|nr:CHAT domain-containing tetratricopeptide repeat protein [Thermoanaerobaculia bacterium]
MSWAEHRGWIRLASVCLVLSLGLAASRSPDSFPAAPVLSPVIEAPPAPLPERLLPLIPNTFVEAALKGGESHRYRIDLPPGQFADIAVEQRGVDVALRLVGSDGRVGPEVDTPNDKQGLEPLPLLGAAGPLELEIRATDLRAPLGRYAVRIGAVRPATLQDRAQVTAERDFAATESLRKKGTGESLRAAKTGAMQAVSRFKTLGAAARAAEALYALGRICDRLGETEMARNAFQEARHGFRTLGDRQAEGRALNSLCSAFLDLGLPREALTCGHDALALHRSLGDLRGEAGALNNLGKAQAARGHSEEALAAYGQALALWRQLGLQGFEGKTLLNQARVFATLGDFERALDELDQALPRLAGQDAAEVLNERGFLRSRAGRSADTAADLARALDLFRQAGDRRGEAVALSDLGLLRLSLGHKESARGAFEEVAATFHEMGDTVNEAYALINLGRMLVDGGDLQGAEADFLRALRVLAARGRREGEAAAWMGIAQIRRTKGDLHEALRASMTALSRIESLRTEPGSPELRTSFFASYQDAFSSTLETAMELHRREPAAGHDARALEVAERARARSLLDALAQAAPPATAFQPLSVRELQRQVLGPEVLLLEYALGERRSFLWAVSSRRVRSYELPPRKVLEDAARRAHGLLADSRRTLVRAPAREALAELSRELLGPLAKELTARRLVVVPDGALHLIPFGALPDPTSPDLPLLARCEVVTAPSSSSLAAIRRRAASRKLAPAVLAVLADPVFDAADPRVTGRRDAAPPRAGTVRRFSRLPFSREEASIAVALAPPGERRVDLDFAARREVATSGALERFRIVHFATHAVVDSEHPELSGIALSMVDETGRTQDGFLRVYEIYRLHLVADLVVLSACETALGKDVRGEGVVGLTRAFLHAGARRVLVSLWPVEDRATADLMRRFYAGLFRDGLTPAAALRQAQDDLRRQPNRQAPHYWAGFVLQGDWS